MKKFSILTALVLIITGVFGQIEENYQLPCKDFNNWPDTLPFHWYSFSNMQCTLDQATCDGATALGIFRNHHKRVTGRQGWGSACQLYTVNKVNRNINGALTTGQAIVQSTTLTDTSNYVYTDRGGTCHKLFYGRPDSISVWARFSFFQNDYPQAMMRIHIHGDVDYQDRPAHVANTPQAGKIANAYCYLTNPATTPNSNGLYKSGWTRFSFKFTYWDANNNPIATPTTTNTPLPSYILANLSTNRELGVGENDSIAFDDIYCIYDKGLASLKIDGVEVDDIRNYCNNSEFNTHDNPNSNSGSVLYPYTLTYCYDDENDLPHITATPRSSLILGCTITQPTLQDPVATITVTHNDNSTFIYKIKFYNLVQNVSVSLDHADGIYTVCEGQPVTVTATTDAQDLVWTLNNNTYSSNTTIHPTTSGTYTVTVSNPNGCSASANAYVTINPLPNVTITGNNTICEGKTSTLTANGAHTYSWSTGETTTSINVGATGTYTVTGTSSQGCTNTTSTTVTVNPTPNVTIDAPAFLCSGNSATLTASGANTYSWSGGATGSTLTITSGGLYSVTGTNNYTCTASASVNVQGRTTPVVSISGPDLVCTGSSHTLTATSNPAGANFTWSTGATGNTLAITSGGNYSVTASLNGCESNASKSVSSSTPPSTPTVSGDTRCGTGALTLTANTGSGNTCLWYESSTTQNVAATGDTYAPTLSTPGTYTYYVCAQNSDGCVSMRVPVTATAYTLPDAPTVTNIRHCGAFDYTLTANGSGTIHWYTDANGDNETTANQHITQTTTYYAAVVDEHLCRSSLVPLTVTIDNIPGLPTVTQPDPICSNTSVNITLNATPGVNGTNVAWYNNNHTSVGSGTNYTAKNLTSSTTYYASSTNAYCESEQVPVNITINPIPDAPALNCAPRCGAGEVTLNANGQTVKWYSADNQYLGEGATYTTTISNTTDFHATVTSQGCVSTPASVTAVVKPVYSGIIDNQTACVSYTWEGTTYNTSGNYTKTLTSSLNCDSIVTLHLTINSGYNQSFDTTVCDQFVWQGQTYTTSQSITKTLQSSRGCDSTVTYNLTVKRSTQSTQTLVICSDETPYNFLGTTITTSGTYTIHIPNAAGCDSTITLNVTVNPVPNNPTITTTNPARCGAGTVALNASSGTNGNTCRWYAAATGGTPLTTNISYNPSVTSSTTYYVSSYNSNTGCESGRESVSITVNAVPAEPQVTNAARCGTGVITLMATADNNATTCRWYSNATTTASLHTGYSYTTETLSATRNYYVESFNESTGCKSSTRAVAVATVNTIPAVPQTTPATNCGPLTADLANYVSNYPLYRWYNSAGTFLTESAHYNTTITATTSYLVSSYNAETTCESEKSTLTITINPVYETQHLYDTICQFSHYQQYNISQDFNEAGTFNFTINELSSNGCDSVVILHLLVKPQITKTITDEACTQYTWNGTVYSTSGSYTQTFTAANGCDSVVTLQLTIYPAVTSSFSASACTSYTWNDITYTTSGDHTQTLQTIHGCDSVVTLHLTIYPAVSTEFSAAQCTSYTWNNVTYTESGDYTQNLQTAHGCDSIVSLHLTIYPTKTFEFLDTACVSYTWNNETYTQSGDYTQHFTTSHGCDSTVTLHLTIHSPSDIAVSDQVCAGVPYSGYGFTATYDEAGTYTLEHQNQNIYGCDSITTLTLTVHPVKQTEIFEEICFNSSYNFNGTLLTTSGTYVDTLPTIHNCDSIITLHLTVWPERRDTIEADVCQGESYHINGFNINNATATDYHQIINPDIHGCDSTTVLLLRVHMPTTTQILDTICQGDIYNENGFTVNGSVPGVVNRQLNLATSFGCDSTVTLQLTVLPTYNIELTDTVCSGTPYQNYGFDTLLTQVRNHTLVYNGQTIHGCDSTATITVTVNPVLRTTLNESICFNGSYNFHGTTLTTAGTYIDTLSTVKGCDSIITLHLNVYPERRDTIFGAVCLGESYTQNGFNITNATTSGYHSNTGSDVHGCDSTTVLYLVVNQPATTEVTGSICLGESYTENGFNLTPAAAGIVTDTLHLQTSHSCDSTVTLTLTVRPTSTYEFSATNCTSYQWNDSIYYQSGDFVQHFNNINGCDSTVTLHLTIHPTATYAFWDTACVSYTWAGTTYTQSGDYTKHFETIHGCDSAVTLHLTIHPTATYAFWDTACVSYAWAGTTYTQSGEYTKHFETIHGCDSTVTLHLTIHPTATYTFWDTACVSYTWAGTTYTQSGDYTKHFETIHGCDSTVTLHLTIHPTATYAFWDTACVSYTWAGTTYAQSGDYTKHFETIYGCDSTVTLHLTINSTSTYEFSDTNCTSYQWNDSIYYQSGDYIQHFNNINGCDSTVTLHLTIHPTATYAFWDTACVSYTWADSIYTQSGEYTRHFETIHGCDSTVTLHLTIHPAVTYAFWDTACVSYTWAGTTYTQSGDYTKHFETIHGCDSTVTLHLTIHPTSTYEFSATNCTSYQWNDSIYYQSGDYIQHFYNVNGCDSTVTLHLTIHPTATYTFWDTACVSYTWAGTTYTQSGDYTKHFETIHGCDSAVTLHLTIHPAVTYAFWDTACVSYTWANTSYTQSGDYTKHFETIHGCDSAVTLHLTIHTPNQVSFFEHICANDHYVGHGFDTTISQPGTYTMTHQGLNMYGCDSTTTLQLTVHELDTTHIYASICRGEQYTDNGFDTIVPQNLEPGEYDFFRYENVSYGCEYTLILHLTVNPLPVVNLLDTICAGTPYSAYGFDTTITTAGTHTMTHVNPSIHGCDSTTTLQLTVHPIFHTTLNASICFDSSYNFNGEILTASGVYYDTLQTVHGCDSTFTLNLTVFPEKRDTLTDAICLGESYQLHGFDLTDVTTTGYHSITNPDVNGCDSTTVLFLTVNLPAATAVTGTICLGESYTKNGFNLTPAAAGIVTDTLHLQTTHDCDSTVTLTLTVNPVHDLSFTDEICSGEAYTAHGFDTIFTQAGTYTLTHENTNIYGCDSTTTVTLTVNPSYNTSFSIATCDNFTWDGTTYTQSGTYTKQYTTVEGCDSIVTLLLAIQPSLTTEFTAAQCISYTWNDSTYYQSGDYTQDFLTVNGCDSTVTLHLTIHSPSLVEVSDEACTGVPYTGYGFDTTFAQTGTYTLTHETTNIYGCDSTTTVTLTVNPSYNTNFSITTCDSYTWDDTTYTQSGTYTNHYTTVEGCDSVVTLLLTIHPSMTTEFTAAQCVSYSWNDSTYYQSGDYTQNFLTVHGCDSTVTLHLTIYPNLTSEFSETACVSYPWNDSIYYQTGNYIQHFETEHGCDSTVTLHLTIHSPSNIAFTDEICAGVTYTSHGFDTTFAQAGIYTLTHEGTNMDGCDSTTTVTLTVRPVFETAISRNICFNSSYNFNGTLLTASGIYVDTLSTIHGCDSVVTLDLTVWPERRDSLEADICLGESYYENGFNITAPTTTGYHSIVTPDIHGCDSTTVLLLHVHEPAVTQLTASICQGERYTANGFNINGVVPGVINRTLHYETSYGCDSTVNLHLTVLPTHNIDLTDTVCAGVPYQQYGFDTLLTQARKYTLIHTGTNHYGCDSTTTLQLTVLPNFRTEYSAAICFNESYNFNGQILTTSGSYSQTLTTENGCDSVVVLRLTVRPEKQNTIVAHICKGDSYHQNGFDIDTPQESGTYDRTDPDINGCDSTTILQLYVHELDTTHLNAILCEGEPYTENGFDIAPLAAGEYDTLRTEDAAFGCEYTLMLHLTVNPTHQIALADTVCANEPYQQFGFDTLFTVPGAYTLTNYASNVYGCDSTTTLQLTVLPTSVYEFADTACASYTWNDSTYTQSGDHIQHFTNIHGCDSVVTLHLTINPTFDMDDYLTICENELPYTYGDTVFEIGTPTSSEVVFHLSTVNGCDSTVTLHLTITNVLTYEFADAACVSYTWNDSTYYQSNDYTQHFTAANGCDSTVTLHLTIYPAVATEDYLTICENELPYTYGDTVFEVGTPASSVVDFHLSTVNGCDSIATLHLTVNPAFATDDYLTICESELPYTYGDTVFEVGTPAYSITTYHLSTINGCDSIVTLHLTVNPTFSTDTTVDVCDVDLPFVWNNSEYFYIGGLHEIHYTSSNSCDSVFLLTINVHSSFDGDTAVTICQGALPYSFDESHSFDQAGEYTINLLTENGCDSIWHLLLTATPNIEHTFSQTICDNELPYTYMGQQFDAAGTYDITETDDDNCLTITHFTLIVNPSYHGYDTVTVCQEELPVTYGSTTLTASGDYDIHFPAANTCDSLITVHFTVIPTATGVEEQYVCTSDFPVVYGGQTFTQEGVYPVTFHRDGLCDSVVTFTLHEAQEYLMTETDNVCDHELPYLWRGQSLTQSGIYYDSLTSQHGCDSVYRLQLTVNETQFIVSNPIVLCQGETQEWRGMTLSEEGIYRDTVVSTTTGCNEIYEVTVSVHPTYLFHDTVTICSDELPYTWHGLTLNEAGFREIILQTVGSYCDSIYRLTLFVNPTYNATGSASVCDYDLPYLWHGQSLTASGTYYDTLTTVNGCDSTFAFTLTVNTSIHESVTDTICAGELPYSWRGHQINAAGHYADTIPNAAGCQDVFELTLTVFQGDEITLTETVCQGSHFDLYGFDTTAVEPGTLYDQITLTNTNGCDSIVNLVLHVLPTYLFETNAETCENVPFAWHGGEFVAEGTYYDSLVTSTGCDSVYILHLTINPTYDIFVEDTAMNGHEYTYDGFVITPSDSGTYHYEMQHYSVAGCDSIVHLTLYVEFNDGVEHFEMLPEFSFYPNPTQAALNISGERMSRIHIYDLNGKLVLIADPDTPEQTRINVTGFATGHYVVRVILDDGKTVTGKIIVNRR